jgi:hypothetical protein
MNKFTNCGENCGFNHVAIKTHRNSHLNFGKNGKHTYILSDFTGDFVEMQHKEINMQQRLEMRAESMGPTPFYDYLNVFRLALRNKLEIEHDMKDLSVYGKTRSSYVASLYNAQGLLIVDGTHFSQIEPHDFFHSKYFERVK